MKFLSLLPSNVLHILEIIQNSGFDLTIVGGAVRDFYKDQKLSHDLDFELRSKTLQNNDVLIYELKKHNLSFEVLPYQIVKVLLDDFDLEFSAPRIEVDIPKEKSHHHFNAYPNYQLDHIDSFIRRDFSINAIGIELDVVGRGELLVDPFGGVADIKNKNLRHINNASFTRDYVRFLRLIRFSVKYDFSIDETTQVLIENFDLSQITNHYIKHEMLKSLNASAFIEKLFYFTEKKSLFLDKKFNFLKKINFTIIEKTSDANKLIADVYLNNDKELALNFAQLLGMPISTFKDMDSFYKSYLILLNHNHDKTLQQNFEEISDFSFFKDLKNYFEKNKWQSYLNLTKLYNEEDFQGTKIEDALMEKTSKDKRSFLKCFLFYKKAHETTKL